MSTFTELLAQSREGVGRLPEGLAFCQETVEDLDLTDLEFKDTVFRSCRFSRCDFSGASFLHCRLEDCDLTGCRIVHKMFGAGTVLPGEGQFMVIDFNGMLKKFSYTASMNSGYLTAEDPAVEAELQAYQDYNKEKDRLEKELKNMKAELVKL